MVTEGFDEDRGGVSPGTEMASRGHKDSERCGDHNHGEGGELAEAKRSGEQGWKCRQSRGLRLVG